jgi:hypothetical protein
MPLGAKLSMSTCEKSMSLSHDFLRHQVSNCFECSVHTQYAALRFQLGTGTAQT